MQQLLLSLVVLVLSCPGLAKQLSFQRTDLGRQVQFQYSWTDADQHQYNLAFAITKRELFEPFADFMPYEQRLMDRTVLMAVQQAAANANARDVRIEVSQVGTELNIHYRASSQQIIDEWQARLSQLAEQTRADDLHKHYYLPYSTPLQANLVKPDHVRFARESSAIVAPVVAAFRQMLGEDATARQTVRAVASWVQSIPYDTLEDRATSSGKGFAPPNNLIYDNQGDCDSKAVLAASILHGLLPYVDMLYVFLPEHALLAISVPWQPGEQVITLDELEYVYLEVAGPGELPLGALSNNTLRLMAQGEQDLEIIDFNLN